MTIVGLYTFRRTSFLVLLILLSNSLFSQNIVIHGKVTEKGSNRPMPFVNIFFTGSLNGTTTNMDGLYTILTHNKPDSIYAAFLGYKKNIKIVPSGNSPEINFILEESIKSLHELVIASGENPANRIIKKAITNKSNYLRSNVDYLKYDSYTKVQIEMDNLSSKIRKRKFFKPLIKLYDTLSLINGTENPNVPIYFSENYSSVVMGKENKKAGDYVKGINIDFVGKSQSDLAAQLSGSDLQDYDFNRDNISFFQKDFLSPLATSAMLFYKYKIIDTTYIQNAMCYKIAVLPKNDQDLTFNGFIWIEDSTFALRRLDLEVSPSVNINFVNKIHIVQEILPLSIGCSVVSRTNLLVDFANITKKLASFIFKVYVSNTNFKTVLVSNGDSVTLKKEFAEDVLNKDSVWWDNTRPRPLDKEELQLFKIIDTISNFPIVRNSFSAAVFLATGYYSIGKIEIGSLQTLYARNGIEGNRYKLSLRTNRFFDKRLTFRTYIAYGTLDKSFKYNAQAEYILRRYPWLKIGINKREDNDQLGTSHSFSRSPAVNNFKGSLYNISSQITDIKKLNRNFEHRVWADAELFRGFIARIVFQHVQSTPLFKLSDEELKYFSFFDKKVITSEIRLEGKWSPSESFIQNGNDRVSLGNRNQPTFAFVFNQGIKNVFGSELNYQKLNLNFRNRIRLGVIGYSDIDINAGKIFSTVPFTILEVHRGNETMFYSNGIFNTMNFFEFISDEYISLNYQQHLMGFLFNRIPIIKKLKWREVLTFNAVYGNISSKNAYIKEGNDFTVLNKTPFMEAGFGIENIFKIGRIDFLYRLNYKDAEYIKFYSLRNSTNVITPFAVKFSLGFGL